MSTPHPTADHALGKPLSGWRLRLYTIIFEADTRAGQLFDRWLIALILASVTVVVLDSVPAIGTRYATVLGALEWGFTLLFTVEYIARLVCVRRPLRYARSFFGVVDLVSLLPTYLALLLPGTHVLVADRDLKLAQRTVEMIQAEGGQHAAAGTAAGSRLQAAVGAKDAAARDA